jgi:mRNA interferase YafQ
MKSLVPTTAFRKDVKRARKRGLDLAKLDALLNLLQADVTLDPRLRVHPLKGEWHGFLECHIAPDWLLIYKTTDDEVVLARTGTHADLFRR